MASGLTQIQARVLDVIRRRLDDGESPPTYRELCAEFGWTSTGTARDHLRALARKGLIQLAGGQARHVRVCGDRVPVAHIPVLGRVVAGVPEAAEQTEDGRVPVPAEWTRMGAAFALRVNGDSMVNAGILDGDIVVVRVRPTASDGEIIVATVSGETTVKRFERTSCGVRLLAENPDYAPIEIAIDDFTVHGVVVGLLRRYHPRAQARSAKGRHEGQPQRNRFGRRVQAGWNQRGGPAETGPSLRKVERN